MLTNHAFSFSELTVVKSEEILCSLPNNGVFETETRELSATLVTHDVAVELVRLQCSFTEWEPYNFKVMIEDVNSSKENATIIVTHSDIDATYLKLDRYDIAYTLDTLDLTRLERPIVLSANSKYNITLSGLEFDVWRMQEDVYNARDHFTLQFPLYSEDSGKRWYGEKYGSALKRIYYQTLTVE